MSKVSRTRNPLCIADLFYCVLDFLTEPFDNNPGAQVRTPDPEGRKALASLARTCRGFTEPALNYLWRKIDSLRPFLRPFRSKDGVYGLSILLGE